MNMSCIQTWLQILPPLKSGKRNANDGISVCIRFPTSPRALYL